MDSTGLTQVPSRCPVRTLGSEGSGCPHAFIFPNQSSGRISFITGINLEIHLIWFFNVIQLYFSFFLSSNLLWFIELLPSFLHLFSVLELHSYAFIMWLFSIHYWNACYLFPHLIDTWLGCVTCFDQWKVAESDTVSISSSAFRRTWVSAHALASWDPLGKNLDPGHQSPFRLGPRIKTYKA